MWSNITVIQSQHIMVVFDSSSIYYRSFLYYGKLKKLGENKNKLRTIYPRNQANLRTASMGSNFTGFYKKWV